MRPGGDGEDTGFVGRVLTELSVKLDVDALDLDPVYHSIDLEQVEAFYRRSDFSATDVIVEFDYYHYTVRIDACGAVSVTPSVDDSDT
jgi:hypothetical protein